MAKLTPLEWLRYASALSAGKAAALGSRTFHYHGSSLPGLVAQRLYPDFLQTAIKSVSALKVVVTGTNGKTTTTAMLAAMGKSAHYNVLSNEYGSNLREGIVSSFVNAATLSGRLAHNLVVLEVDEANLRYVLPDIQPDMVIVTNLFPDQLDRFGSFYNVVDEVEQVLRSLPAPVTVLLNGNDHFVKHLAMGSPVRRVLYTMNPFHTRADVSAILTECVEHDTSHLAIQYDNQEYSLSVPVGGVHNAMNALSAISAALIAQFSFTDIHDALRYFHPAFGRLQTVRIGLKYVLPIFIKNAASCDSAIHYLLHASSGMPALLLALAYSPTMQDVSWLWAADFDRLLPVLDRVVCSATASDECMLRMHYAGMPHDRLQVIPDIEEAFTAAMSYVKPGEVLPVLVNGSVLAALEELSRRYT